MTPAAFHRRVDDLLPQGDTDPRAIAAAIRQAAWEMDHGRTPIDAPVVVMEAAA